MVFPPGTLVFPPGTPVFATAKSFVLLDRMLHHRADPSNTMIGCDNSQTRSQWGVQVNTGSTDQDMLAPDLLPHPPQMSWAR